MSPPATSNSRHRAGSVESSFLPLGFVTWNTYRPSSRPAAVAGAPGPGPPSRYTASLDGYRFALTSVPSAFVVKIAPDGGFPSTTADMTATKQAAPAARALGLLRM